MSSKGSKFLSMPTGMLQGENTGDLPDKGTSRGYTGKSIAHSDGADTSADASNRRGGFKASSDPHTESPMHRRAPKGRA